MAFKNNHNTAKIDKAFLDKHEEIIYYFQAKGVDIEVGNNFTSFRKFLKGLSWKKHPYNYDETFSGEINDGFSLT